MDNLVGAERVREFYRKQGELREQDRIINLLKEENGAAPVGWDFTDWIIALILDKERQINVVR